MRHERHPYVSSLLVVVGVGALVCSAAASDQTTETLWNGMVGKPNPYLMDNFEVIEGIALIKTEEGISPEAAALSALLTHQISSKLSAQDVVYDEFFVSASFQVYEELIDTARKEHGVKPPDAKGDAVREWFNGKLSHATDRVERTVKILQGGKGGPVRAGTFALHDKYRTQGVRNALFMQQYMDDAKSIRRALELFAQAEFLSMKMQHEPEATFGALQEAIHKGIPVWLGQGESWTMCVGYVTDDGKQYAVVYRPSASEYEKKTGYELSHAADRNSDDPRVKRLIESRKTEVHYRDRFLKLAEKSPPPGIQIVPWREHEKEAFFVYEWKPDLTRLLPEFLEKFGK